MYQVLRVPHNEDQFIKAYNMMISIAPTNTIKQEFPEFYKHVKEIYMLADDCFYKGCAYLSHKKYKNFEQPNIFNRYGDNIFELKIIMFDNADYTKLYDLIRTIIRDSNDRLIITEVSSNNKALINALKNNKFKRGRVADRYYVQTWCYVPIYSKLIEKELMDINPRDDLHTIDKMNSFCCKEHNNAEAEAIERYTKELLEKNRSELVYDDSDNDCFCECGQGGQTEEEFLGKDPECCRIRNCSIDWEI